MAVEDLLNASDFLDSGEPTALEQQVQTPTTQEAQVQPQSDYVDLSEVAGYDEPEDTVKPSDWLPDTLNIAGVDTGIPLDKDKAAMLVGFGEGLTDTWRGIQQIFGNEEMKADLQRDKDAMNLLYNDPRFGTKARVGQVGGMLVDPIGVLVPMGKGKNLWDVTKIGMATGTAFGAFGYVDESNGQTREGNALIGAVTGGLMSPALFASARGIKGVGGEIQERAARSLLKTYERNYWQFIKNGANPTQATQGAMEKMSWSTQDKARLILASRRPFSIEQPEIVGLKKSGKPYFSQVQAQRNLDALQSKTISTIRKGTDALERTSVGRDVMSVARSVGRGIEKAIIPTVTRVAKIDGKLGRDLISMEARVKRAQEHLHSKARGFNKSLNKMGLQKAEEIRFHLQNGERGQARRLYVQSGGRAEDFDSVQGIIRALYNGAIDAGYHLPKLEAYFPRRVKDLEGLSKYQDGLLSEEIRIFRQKMRREPSDKELDALIRNIINKNTGVRAQTGGSLRKRQKRLLEPEEQQFYHETEATLTSYINDMVADIERAKFFQKIGVKKPKDGFALDGSDISNTLNDVIRVRRNRGLYGEGEVKELTGLLRSRFTTGELAPSDAVQAFKNLTYIGTLGNFKSALTQIGDLAFSAHKNGIINTALELMNRVPVLKRIIKNSHERVTKEQLGLEEAIQEFAGDRNGKKALDWILAKTGFKTMDRLGKETFINAHIRKVKNNLTNPKRRAEEVSRLRRKWNSVFGEETEQLIDDLTKGKFSDNVAVYLFNQLEDVQPIALSSMPQHYLDAPNGRIFYMLKSFTIKQLDLMRRDILDTLARGDAPEAFRSLASLGTMFILANGSADMLKDFMSGKEVEMEDTFVDNVWKLAGISRYTGDRLGNSPAEAIWDTISPPVNVYDRLLRSVGDSQKMWEASPFNGLQILDEAFNDGTLTRTDSDDYFNTLSKSYSSIDGDIYE
jgi:hypothetical protein